jgi:hypothetical protein
VAIVGIVMTNDTSKLLTAAELAKALKIGRRTLGSWTAARKIPCLRLSRVVRYDLSKVLAALEHYEQKEITRL